MSNSDEHKCKQCHKWRKNHWFPNLRATKKNRSKTLTLRCLKCKKNMCIKKHEKQIAEFAEEIRQANNTDQILYLVPRDDQVRRQVRNDNQFDGDDDDEDEDEDESDDKSDSSIQIIVKKRFPMKNPNPPKKRRLMKRSEQIDDDSM